MSQRLCREALVWRQLCHANVLPFLGLNTSAFPKNSLPSLLSPWMEYGSLKEYIERPEYDAVEEIPRLVRPGSFYDLMKLKQQRIKLEGIAQGLAYLHSLSITHGDIKHVRISWLRTKRRSYES
jgi:serine/threonine protein kinase